MNFTYNEQSALQAGMGGLLTETGAYICTILNATWEANNGKTLMLSVETDTGLTNKYIRIKYQKNDGEINPYGVNTINAIMGCTGVKELTQVQEGGALIAPQLTNKQVGLFLRKCWYTGQQGDDRFSIEVVCPFSPKSRKTLLEHKENKPAERIAFLERTETDRDNRKTEVATHTNSYGSYQAPVSPVKKTYGQANPVDTFNDIQAGPGDMIVDDDVPF